MKKYAIVILSRVGCKLIYVVENIYLRHPELTERDILVIEDDGCRERTFGRLDGKVTWVRGEKPFVFARNLNIGFKAAGERDVVCLEDDTLLFTPGGLDLLAETAARPRTSIVSAALRGNAILPRHSAKNIEGVVQADQWLGFQCAYFPRAAIRAIGGLDEQFTGYSFDNCDWFARARDAGWTAWIDGRVIADHFLPSSFRRLPQFSELHDRNAKLFVKKWGGRAHQLSSREG